MAKMIPVPAGSVGAKLLAKKEKGIRAFDRWLKRCEAEIAKRGVPDSTFADLEPVYWRDAYQHGSSPKTAVKNAIDESKVEVPETPPDLLAHRKAAKGAAFDEWYKQRADENEQRVHAAIDAARKSRAGKPTPTPWTVTVELRSDLDDDPMGVYAVEQAERTLTERYFAAEPETPEIDAVHAENAANAKLIETAVNSHAGLVKAFKAAVERMEHVSELLPVEKRSRGVSQAAHVRHIAGHLFQHAKIARAALKKAGVRA